MEVGGDIFGVEPGAAVRHTPAVCSDRGEEEGESDMGRLAPWLVKTKFEIGLTEHDARKAIGILESGRGLRDLTGRKP